MAIVQYTAIVNQVRGKLNGSVFNKSKNAFTLGRKGQPKRTASPLQSQRRSIFGNVQRAWKLTTLPERQNASAAAGANPTEDRFGNETVLSGYNHWIKTNVIRTIIGIPILNNINPVPANPFGYNAEDIQYRITQISTGEQILGFEMVMRMITAQTEDVYILVYTTPAVSPGIASYSGEWFLVNTKLQIAPLPVGATTGVNFSENLPVRIGPISESQVVFIRVDVWQVDKGALVNRQVFRLTPDVNIIP